jgi:saccharopine dehydrogenase-like NADP-dependent oxidoreductase
LQLVGFFSEISVYINEQMVKPIYVSRKILFDQWKLQHREEEFTIMRVVVKVIKDGETKRSNIFCTMNTMPAPILPL